MGMLQVIGGGRMGEALVGGLLKAGGHRLDGIRVRGGLPRGSPGAAGRGRACEHAEGVPPGRLLSPACRAVRPHPL